MRKEIIKDNKKCVEAEGGRNYGEVREKVGGTSNN